MLISQLKFSFSHNIEAKCLATMTEAVTVIEVEIVTVEDTTIGAEEIISLETDPGPLVAMGDHVEIDSESLVSQHHSVYCLYLT